MEEASELVVEDVHDDLEVKADDALEDDVFQVVRVL